MAQPFANQVATWTLEERWGPAHKEMIFQWEQSARK